MQKLLVLLLLLAIVLPANAQMVFSGYLNHRGERKFYPAYDLEKRWTYFQQSFPIGIIEVSGELILTGDSHIIGSALVDSVRKKIFPTKIEGNYALIQIGNKSLICNYPTSMLFVKPGMKPSFEIYVNGNNFSLVSTEVAHYTGCVGTITYK